MADPTVGELDTQFASDCALPEKLRLAAITQANPYAGLVDIAQQNLEGDFTPQRSAAAAAHRALVAATITDRAIRSMISPALLNYGKLIDSRSKRPENIIDDLYDYMQSFAVASQGKLTLDTVPIDANNDTMTIGGVTYRFKDTPAQAEDIAIGASLAACKLNIVATILGTGAPVTNYYVGSTVPHPTVKCAAAFVGDDLTLTARTKGTAGDSIATTETFTAGTNVFDAATLGTTTAGVAPRTVQSVIMSFGAISATSTNSGNGTIKKATVNRDNHEIESCFADVVTVQCTKNGYGSGGAENAQFEIRGRAAGVDRIVVRGATRYDANATLVTPMTELSALDSANNGIQNANFAQLTSSANANGEALTVAPAGWAVNNGDFTLWKISSGSAGSEYYRDLQGVSSPKGLDVYETMEIEQRISIKLSDDAPYARMLIFKRENAATGELKLRIGAFVGIVDVSDTADGGFGILEIGPNRESWATEFNEYDATVKGNRATITFNRISGNIIICELIFARMTEHDTLFYAAVPNATGTTLHVPFSAGADGVDGDKFTFTNTQTGAIVQRSVQRAYRKFLPHVNGSETITEPTVT